jgi:hypothetical protein
VTKINTKPTAWLKIPAQDRVSDGGLWYSSVEPSPFASTVLTEEPTHITRDKETNVSLFATKMHEYSECDCINISFGLSYMKLDQFEQFALNEE